MIALDILRQRLDALAGVLLKRDALGRYDGNDPGDGEHAGDGTFAGAAGTAEAAAPLARHEVIKASSETSGALYDMHINPPPAALERQLAKSGSNEVRVLALNGGDIATADALSATHRDMAGVAKESGFELAHGDPSLDKSSFVIYASDTGAHEMPGGTRVSVHHTNGTALPDRSAWPRGLQQAIPAARKSVSAMFGDLAAVADEVLLKTTATTEVFASLQDVVKRLERSAEHGTRN